MCGLKCFCLAVILLTLLHLAATTKNGEASNLYPPGDPIAVVGVMSNGQLELATGVPSSPAFPSNVVGHVRNALFNAFPLFAHRMRVGLAQLPQTLNCATSSCTINCVTTPLANFVTNCTGSYVGVCGSCTSGCSATTRQAAHVVVPAPTSATTSSNLASLVSYVDTSCTDDQAITAYGDCAPYNGLLRGIASYLSGTYVDPITSATLTSPLNDALACKTVHIGLIHLYSTFAFDCGSSDPTAFRSLITSLSNTGLTVNGKTFKVKVSLYSYYSSLPSALNAFDTAAQTAGATIYQWSEDVALTAALSRSWLATSVPDTCNNLDDDCDGEVDEDYAHYCNLRSDCCVWGSNETARATCLTAYLASITVANPQGNPALLPCTTAAQSLQSSTWLCYNAGEQCNGVDDNCDGQIDEGFARCGSPLHCPTAEVCNGLDDDCNGLVDDGVNCNGCVPSLEVCDGCDNDCNGLVDDFPAINVTSCGSATPAWCQGQMSCQAPVSVAPGGCVAGRGWTACANSPQTETCNAIDDDCNGEIDDNVAPSDCEPEGVSSGLVYDGSSQCRQGRKYCGTTACVGFVGPSVEVCDGIDNDCNGSVDDNVPQAGQPCGRCVGQGACSAGTTACIEGQLVCQNEVSPQVETLNGLDDNCNTIVDDV